MRPVARPVEFSQRTEERERAALSTWASLAADTKGRDRYEEPDRLRTVFQVDADRVARSAAFRALAGKSSTLPARGAPTRLFETLEVARVAASIARALRLNEDLTEAVALGHALGATAFADAGEEALSAFTERPYQRAEHSLRIVERLARGPGGPGLNLTWETRDGILQHAWEGPPPATAEGQAVRLAALVVAVTLPLAEACAGGALATAELPGEARRLLGEDPGGWATAFAEDAARASLDRPEITLGPGAEECRERLAAFARARLHGRPAAVNDRDRALHCMRTLAVFALERGGLPGQPAGSVTAEEVIDRLAACTDEEVLRAYREVFEPAT